MDASRPAIGWARENAALNGVSTIRWIHEDARRFVDRERRRGRQYDALLLDPPAFGRGPAGDWQLDRDLAGLLESAIALLRPDPAFVLLNVYTGGLDAGDLDRLLAWALDARPDAGGLGPIEADTLSLTSADGRQLPTGVYARAARRRAERAPPPTYVDTPSRPRVSWNSTKPAACAAGTTSRRAVAEHQLDQPLVVGLRAGGDEVDVLLGQDARGRRLRPPGRPAISGCPCCGPSPTAPTTRCAPQAARPVTFSTQWSVSVWTRWKPAVATGSP